MTTALITHPACLNHLPPPGHPERPERLQAINAKLAEPAFDGLLRVEAPLAGDEDILRAHPVSHLKAIKAAAPSGGIIALDADSYMSSGSLEAACRAAGAIIKAVDLVISGQVDNAFCAIRPPGHHAERTTPMGFCLFGNVVIGARHALENHGLDRVAIVDFDVHHGNGTQDIIWDDARILFASTQQIPLYPGSGAASETGAHGNVVNVPLAPYSGSSAFREGVMSQILPALRRHKPQMIFISAGFDAHVDDPLANLNLTESDFSWVTREICKTAIEFSGGRVVSTLEGGYDLDALAASTAAHVQVLMEQNHD